MRWYPQQIRFLDVIEAIDGPIQINTCMDDKSKCEVHELCSMYTVWETAQDAMVGVFRSHTIGDVMRPDRVCENLIRFGEHRSKPISPAQTVTLKRGGKV